MMDEIGPETSEESPLLNDSDSEVGFTAQVKVAPLVLLTVPKTR
jgi:hypothetical protein